MAVDPCYQRIFYLVEPEIRNVHPVPVVAERPEIRVQADVRAVNAGVVEAGGEEHQVANQPEAGLADAEAVPDVNPHGAFPDLNGNIFTSFLCVFVKTFFVKIDSFQTAEQNVEKNAENQL